MNMDRTSIDPKLDGTLTPEQQEKNRDDEDTAAIQEMKNVCVDKLCRISYFFACEMFKYEEENQKYQNIVKEAQEWAKTHPEEPVKVFINTAENNAQVMKNCLKATTEVISFIRHKDSDVEKWQLAGIIGIFEQIKKEGYIPFDLPYSIKGLLLQWDE